MRKHGVRRLVVAGTAADPGYHASDALVWRLVMEPLFMVRRARTAGSEINTKTKEAALRNASRPAGGSLAGAWGVAGPGVC